MVKVALTVNSQQVVHMKYGYFAKYPKMALIIECLYIYTKRGKGFICSLSGLSFKVGVGGEEIGHIPIPSHSTSYYLIKWLTSIAW